MRKLIWVALAFTGIVALAALLLLTKILFSLAGVVLLGGAIIFALSRKWDENKSNDVKNHQIN